MASEQIERCGHVSVGIGRRPPEGEVLIFAHRGASMVAPENTIEAAQRGLNAGADAWELDVQMSRDGVPVVIHDDSLARTTNVETLFSGDPREGRGWLVADFDLVELKKLDAGSWFVQSPYRSRSAGYFGSESRLSDTDRAEFTSGLVRIPTLREALDWTMMQSWQVNVELKSVPLADQRLVQEVSRVLRAAKAEQAVLISSFDHDDLIRTKLEFPSIPTAALTVTPLARLSDYVVQSLGCVAYHPSVEAIGGASLAYRNKPCSENLRVADVRELAAKGIAVSVFTVNDGRSAGLAKHLVDAGVTGLFTDDPASLVGCLRSHDSELGGHFSG